jgi:hypothetical protein
MAGNISIKLDMKRLDGLPDEVRRNGALILDKAAFEVDAGAKMRAPVDTSALKNSITVSAPAELTREVSDGVEYGVHQEYGTTRHSATPFMTPAVEAVRQGLESAWKELISE